MGQFQNQMMNLASSAIQVKVGNDNKKQAELEKERAYQNIVASNVKGITAEINENIKTPKEKLIAGTPLAGAQAEYSEAEVADMLGGSLKDFQGNKSEFAEVIGNTSAWKQFEYEAQQINSKLYQKNLMMMMAAKNNKIGGNE